MCVGSIRPVHWKRKGLRVIVIGLRMPRLIVMWKISLLR